MGRLFYPGKLFIKRKNQTVKITNQKIRFLIVEFLLLQKTYGIPLRNDK